MILTLTENACYVKSKRRVEFVAGVSLMLLCGFSPFYPNVPNRRTSTDIIPIDKLWDLYYNDRVKNGYCILSISCIWFCSF